MQRLRTLNTLRNQILFVFLFVMMIVLLLVSGLTLNQVSSLLKDNAEEQIHQTVVEANGRIDSLYEQINMISKFVITNDSVQSTLNKNRSGARIHFSERQQLGKVVNNIQANSEGIFSFELYTNTLERLLPLDDSNLPTRISPFWIREAHLAKGGLVWIGEDPQNPNHLLAIRRVNLLDYGYANGGYLLISIYEDYFQFPNEEQNQFSILLDEQLKTIVSNYNGSMDPILLESGKFPSTIVHKGKEYMVSHHRSDTTKYTVVHLTPVHDLTNGISGIRLGIIISGLIGLIIFFLCSWFLSTLITNPIIKLTKTMRQAGNGSLETNPNVVAGKEINELNSTYNQLVEETNHLIKMVYQKEIIRSQSELKALQAQINPHFLYNTLDALRWSLEEKDEEELAEFVVALSNLFRYTISRDSDHNWVTLEEEIKHIEDYLEIITFRFGEKINWQLDLPIEWKFTKIPKLIIQPFVENAVLHGSDNHTHSSTIKVSITPSQEDGLLQITIEDNGSGMEEEKIQHIHESLDMGGTFSQTGNGIAISNVYKRLQLYYQSKSEFTITSKLNMGTRISFKIPVNGGSQHV